MREWLRRVNVTLKMFGIDLQATATALKGWSAYRRDLKALRAQQATAHTRFALGTPRPCLGEGSSDSGLASGHYFHQDLLVARRIHENAPRTHVDVGSRVDGFVAHVAAFRDIQVFDIRALHSTIPHISTVQADMMTPVDERLVGYCDSLSCLHALEHFGLGRYGDSVNWDGHLLGLENLHRILQSGGTLYLSVPIGPQRIEFNAHRVFSVAYLLEQLQERYRIERFSFVDDRGDLHEDVPLTDSDVRDDFGCRYGCGIFEMTKL